MNSFASKNKNSVTNQIINKISIVDFIGNYVDLTKKGQNYTGICPFHDDNNPSFTVNENKKIYKCFVCGVGGNVIKFNQEINHLNFAQSVIALGKSCGVDVSSFEKRNMNNPLFNEAKQPLIELNNSVNEVFEQMLVEDEGAQKYLQSRNLKQDTIKHFHIGYKNANVSEIADLLAQINIDFKTQEESSLVVFTKDKIIDFFRERIMIPIFDEFNNIIGFGSRIINNQQDVKYLNTKENMLFNKREILFNLYQAKKDIFDNNKSTIIVVEGYMDVISLYNQNIKNVVAVMTNNITNEQVQKLTALNKQILLCLDFDQAGMQGTYDFFQKYPSLNAKIVKLSKNLDPDEFIQKHGRNKLIESIVKPISFADFLFEVETNNVVLNLNKRYENKNDFNPNIQEQNKGLQPPGENNFQDFDNQEFDAFQKQQKSIDFQSLDTKKLEFELINWMYEHEKKYICEQKLKNLQVDLAISHEHKQYIRLEFSVFKWYINKQISRQRILEYLQILNTSVIKKWIAMDFEQNNALNNIKTRIKGSLAEGYSQTLDQNIYHLITRWHETDLAIEALIFEREKINDDGVIRRQINELLWKQRQEFFLNFKDLRS